MQVESTIRAGFARLFASALLFCASLAWTPVALAQHASGLCPVQSGTVANGGSVVIEVTDCVDFFGPGVGAVVPDPTHGTAVLSDLFTAPSTYQAFVTYHHNGNSATSDTFTFDDEYGDAVQVNITISPATSSITVAPASISLQTGVNFNTTLVASGGSAPYTYTLESGTVPAGMTLSGDSFSGTPTQRTPFSFTVRATDSLGDFVLKSYGGTIADPAIGATPASTTIVQNQASTLTFAGTGGTPGYSFSLHSGTLPTGTALQANGDLTGTPTATGTFNFSLVVNDSTTDPACPGCDFFAIVPVSVTVAALPSLSIDDVSLAEGNAGTTNAVFTVSLSAPAGAGGVSFDITTTPGTATSDEDYVSNSLTGQTIPAGNSSYSFTVVVNGDLLNEADETYFVDVTNVANAVVADGQGGGTISNDDALPTITITNTAQVEGNSGTSTAQFAAVLSAASGQVVTVGYATSDGTATAGSDYVSASGTLTFNPGTTAQNVDVTVNGDQLAEPDETFDVTLSAPTNASINTGTATGTITNDDVPVTISPTTLPDGMAGTAYSETLSASGGTGPYDFSLQSGTLPAGITLGTSGALSGTPTVGGSFNFTVLATDSSPAPGPNTATQAYTLVIDSFAPDAPVIGTATAGDTEATVTFSAPADDGGSPITSYTVSSSVGGFTATGAGSPLTVTGLSNGTAYTFTVTATNAEGTSPPSAASNSVTPAAPQTITFANPGAQNFGTTPTLSATSTSGLPVSFTSSTTGVCTIETGGALTFLTAGTCTINADQAGSSAFLPAPQVSRTFSVNTVVPGAPTAAVATAGDTQATVTFTAPASDGGSTITLYTATSNPGTLTGTSAGGPITVTGLTNGVAYTFTVTAENAAGTGAASAASNSVTPAANQNITFADPGPQDFGTSPTLSATADSGLTPVFTSSTPGVCAITAGGALSFLTAGDCTINADQPGNGSYLPAPQVTHTFAVNAVVPDAPTIGTATAGNASASITFTPPAFTGGETITGYTVTSSPGSFTGTGTGSPIVVTGLSNGTPYTFTVTATTSAGTSVPSAASNSVTPLAPVIVIDPAALTDGTVGVAYSQLLTASGGVAPYAYAVTSGSLPAGLSLAGDTLDGTPTAPGVSNFTLTATDDNGDTGDQAYVLTILAPTITLGPGTLSDGTVGMAYTQAITASGGTGPYTYAISGGALPAGVTLAADGTLAGTPTAAGSFNFTVEATDSFSQTGDLAYTLTVLAPTITLAPTTLTDAAVGVAYTQAITASGGTGPYTYALSGGALPAGLTLAADGTLAGTPTAAGSFNFTVEATDSFSQTGDQAYSLTVTAATLVLSATPLADGVAGTVYSRTITVTGGVGPYTFAITAGALPAGLGLSSGGGVDGTPSAAGTFSITVQATDSFGQTGSRTYTFTITAPTLVLAPAGLGDGTVGTAYAASFSTTGGTAPYTYALTAGSLPAGLGLASNGSLTGTPTTDGSSSFTVTSTDLLGFSTSQAYTLVIGLAAPVAVADVASTLAGEPVLIAVSGNDTGVATSVAVAAAPANGTATVAGMDINYTPADGFSGTDTFTYTATGPGGTSAPATVTVTVNPVPFAPDFSTSTTPAMPVQVTLTTGATGGPFTGADVVAVTPAGAGTTSIAAAGANYVLTFTPAAGFSGPVTVSYTLDNAFATSDEGLVSILVEDRPDPSKDAEVQGTIDAQSESTHRFASGQISNFQQRMERLHGGGDQGGVENGIGFAVDRPCIEPLVGRTVDPCNNPSMAGGGGNGLAASADGRGARAANNKGPLGIWTGGMIRSGSDDGRDGNADISFETDGLSTGVDYRVNDALVLGGGFGYGRDDNAIGGNGTRVDGSARTIALYASYHPGDMFFLDSLVGYQQLDFDTRRYVTANGGLVSGQRDGDQWFASVSVGADIVRDELLVTPYARFDIERATLDSYTETGDPIHALHYEAMDVDNSSGSLGLRLDHQNVMAWGRFTPQLRLEYQRDFGGRSEALVRYADLLGGPRYGLLATDFDRNRFMLGLGALFDLDSGWGWRLEYMGQVGNGDGADHGLSVNVQKQF